MLAIKLSQVYKWARGLTGNSSFWLTLNLSPGGLSLNSLVRLNFV